MIGNGKIARVTALVLLIGAQTSLARAEAAPVLNAPGAEAPNATVLNVTDERPVDEATYKVLSRIATSCNFQVIRMGGRRGTTDGAGRVDRLKADLVAAFGDKLNGRTLTVKHYGIFFNPSAHQRRVAMAAVAGAVGGFIATASSVTHRPACEKSKMTGGWFDPADLTNGNAPMTIEIEVSLDGQTYSVNSAYSPSEDYFIISKSSGDPLDFEPVSAVMAKAHTLLIEKMKPQIDAPPAVPPASPDTPST